jgi:hypothetical protein
LHLVGYILEKLDILIVFRTHILVNTS